VTLTAAFAKALNSLDDGELRTDATPGDDADAVHERVARVACHLSPPDLRRLVPLLLEWWAHGGPATRWSAERALRRDSTGLADIVAECLRSRLDAGAWGFLALIEGRPLLRTPELAATCERLRAEGRVDLADKLVLEDGPLRHLDAQDQDSAALAALRDRPPSPAVSSRPPRQRLVDLIRSGNPEQARHALTRLVEAHEDNRTTSTDPDPELEKLIVELLDHPERRIRLHAHRIGRRILDRPTYLRHTVVLLNDPQPDTVRQAIRTLCHAAHRPAIPAVVGLLAHPHAGVRRTAADGLLRIGSPAIPALRHAVSRVRPDKRQVYTTILDQITEPEP
jgi:hypothetical protein